MSKPRILEMDIPPYYTLIIDGGHIRISSVSKRAKGRDLTFYNKDGYLRVKLNNKTHCLHELVAHYVLGARPKGLVINHKDGNKLNNNPDNLEYVTIRENVLHSIKIGHHVANAPERNGNYKDGRTVGRLKEYKHEWYLRNKERLLKKQKERRNEHKA